MSEYFGMCRNFGIVPGSYRGLLLNNFRFVSLETITAFDEDVTEGEIKKLNKKSVNKYERQYRIEISSKQARGHYTDSSTVMWSNVKINSN